MGEIFKRERPTQPLEFTGERLTSDIGGQIELEHCHRYFLARELARGLDVLDVAAGEGYGSAYLSKVARSVIGVDLDPAAVFHAQENYRDENLTFKVGSATDLPLPDGSVDAVFSFETIEHFYDHDRFLEEVRRVLRPGGVFVVSTPERDIYTPANTKSNPYHVRELIKEEFDTLIGRHFKYFGMLHQRVILGSVLAPDHWPSALSEPFTIERRGDELFETSRGLPRAPYLVAVASDAPLPQVGTSFYIENGYVRDRESDLTETKRLLEVVAGERENARGEMNQLRDALAFAQQVVDERGDRIDELEKRLQVSSAEYVVALDNAHGEINQLRGALSVAQQVVDERGDRIDELEKRLQMSSANLTNESVRRIGDLEDALAALAVQLARAREDEGAARTAGELQRAALAEACHAREVEARAAEETVRAMRSKLDEVSRAHEEIVASTTWQIGRPLRAAARVVSPGMRRAARRGVRLLWWVVTFRLPRKLRERREAFGRNSAR